jgi:N-acyl-D-aspartate/D-glutamate deacylase
MFDTIILNGIVIDGTGRKRKKIDIGINNEDIITLGELKKAKGLKIIDAKGLYITPGFIDLHTHSDFALLLDGSAESFARQGVTTQIIGNCGFSCAPLKKPEYLRRNIFGYIKPYKANWTKLNGYLEILEKKGLGTNVIALIGHAAIRSHVMGYENRSATIKEVKKMTEILEESIEQGAFGLSTGLEYFPGNIASDDEITSLLKVIKKHDCIYATHVRNRDEKFASGFSEAFRVAEKMGIKLQISHAVPKYGAPKMASDWFLEELSKYGKTTDIACDVIPYVWGPTSVTAILPNTVLKNNTNTIIKILKDKRVREQIKNQKRPIWLLFRDRCWDKICIYHSIKYPEFIGKSLIEISKKLGVTPFDAIIDFLIAEGENMFSALMIGKIKNEKDLKKIINHPLVGVISDGMSLSIKGKLKNVRWSPGCYGWVPRFIKEYTGEGKNLALEAGIAKITGFPSKRLGLKRRGLIKSGYKADIVIFSFDDFNDKSNFLKPGIYPDGLKYVLINGKVVINNCEDTGKLAGKVLKISINN